MTQPEDAQPTAEIAHPPRQLKDVHTMRALAHPSRMALWELLTVHGPMTATQAAEHVDDSPSNCSFHLRQLAKYGLVEEADDVVTVGRARPWRVTQIGFTTAHDPDAVDVEFEIAEEALHEAVLNRSVDRYRQWQRLKHSTPEPWRETGGAVQTVWWITAEEAAELTTEIYALAFRFHERLADPAQRPKDARPIEFISLIHPFDTQSEGSHEGEPGEDDL